MFANGNGWLNYHHLYYFWRVAHEGSLSRAASSLRLSHSTLSTQIRSLEEHVHGELFVRSGRSLQLTALGNDILHYANEIFRLGIELSESVDGKTEACRVPLHLGVVSSIPRMLLYRLIEPALQLKNQGPLHLHQGSLEQLLSQMSAGGLHLILSDEKPPQGLSQHVYCRVLAEPQICIYGAAQLVRSHREDFPQSLAGAKMLLPSRSRGLRARLEDWLAQRQIAVQVVGEFDDIESMRVFGAQGHALFPAHALCTADADTGLGIESLGPLPNLVESIYAVFPERRSHRADVKRILETAVVRTAEPPVRTAS